MVSRRPREVLAAAALVLVAVGCGSEDDTAAPTTVPVTTATIAPATIAPATTAAPTTSTTSTVTGIDEALRDELLEMFELDQAVRTGIAPPGDDRTEDELFAAMDAVDAANQARLAEILDEHGWPGWSLVGEDGSTAAWAIVQHADLDLAFQERGLELLREAVDAGDASPGALAYLVDRVRVGNGEPQLYGTQWGAPIEDEANVDARRAEVGLGTLAEYEAEMEAMSGEE